MGQYRVTSEKEPLTATGIGSCLVITLFDRKNRYGGMAHASLPISRNGSQSPTYVDSVIPIMLKDLERLGTGKDDIECKIVGGSNMFPNLDVELEDIGKKNVEWAKKKLKELRIPLVAESVGGALGRSVEFCLETGIVTVKLKF